jgi:hypothetical protein
MLPDKDTELLQEAYISATQKTVNVPPRVPYRQVGDTHKTATLSDKMQGVSPEEVTVEEPGNSKTETYDDIVKRLITPEEDILDNEQDNATPVGDTSPDTDVVITASLGSAQSEDCENVRMTKTNLYSIFTAAKKLHDIVESGHTPETWMSHRLAICADNMLEILKVCEYEHDKNSCSCS